MKKRTRTISGVTPVAVMARPLPCPGQCVFCPTFAGMPQSYTPESPAVLRALRCDFDPGKQVRMRLEVLAGMGHPIDKVELIVMGGTFLATPVDYQYQLIKECYDALNGTVSTDLEAAKSLNETAAHRCVGLCIESRPDFCGTEEMARLVDFGATRIELGVQMLDDDIYRRVRRGHSVADVTRATTLARDTGLKVHYHWMPGLPGSTPEHDLELTVILFNDARFRPDGMKIYPTAVVEGTELERWYKAGQYEPYDDETMIDLIARMKLLVPPYVRISRVLRDLPAKYITAGLHDSLRDQVKVRLEAQGLACRCIRCREYGHRPASLPPSESELVRLDYEAGSGREVFLSLEDGNDVLYGLLRLRLPDGSPTAIVRELHVYGPELELGTKQAGAAQHRGLGRRLLAEAERIAREEPGITKMAVLSGVGARQYYRQLGYRLESGYMVKALD